MPLGTRRRVNKESIEQSESQRKRPMVGSYGLRRAAGPACRFTGTEDRKRRISVGPAPISRALDVAEELIVRAILFDYVDDVPDGRRTAKQTGGRSNESVIAHDLLRVHCQLSIVRFGNQRDVAGKQRSAVLAAAAAAPAARRKAIVRHVWNQTRVVYN